MNSIPADQNTETQIARLSAQRQLYADAKRLYLVEVIAGVPLAVALAAAAIWVPYARGAAFVSCVVFLLLDVLVVVPLQRRLRRRAARIQEAFDCDVLGMTWRELRCGKRPDVESVHEHAGRFRANGGDTGKLLDWYPREVGTLPLHLARLVCQRANCWWDATQRRRYGWLGVGVVVVAGAVVLAGAVTARLGAEGLAAAMAPLVPSVVIAVRQFVEHQEAARRVDRLKIHAELLWNRALRGELGTAAAATESRELQDKIFDHRSQSPSTIDRLYFRLRPAFEAQMNKGAAAMVEEARGAKSNDGNPAGADADKPASRATGGAAVGGDTAAPRTTPRERTGVVAPAPVRLQSDGRAATEREARSILCVATEWASGRGGLSTFNREFVLACARAGHRVVCYVPTVSEEERAHAVANGVELVAAPTMPGLEDETRLLQRPAVPPDFIPGLIVGHGRVTGPAARVLAEQHFPGVRRVHILHMAPDAIEWFKDRAPGDAATETAEARTRLEVELSHSAWRAVGVGPLLAREFGTHLHARGLTVGEILPGLSSEAVASGPAPGVQCLVLGRAEDFELKGLDIAARAIAGVAARRPDLRVRLMVRGAPPGTGDELRRRLLKLTKAPGLDVVVRSYTKEADRVADDIRQSSVVLVPSRSEGFGLVGLEAISLGVPVLVSDRSGLAEALARDAAEHARACIVPVTCDLAKDAEEWARRLEPILDDREASFRRARRLREVLERAWTWAGAVEQIVAHLPTGVSTS